MSKARVFITRQIPQVAIDKIQRQCHAVIWNKNLPPTPAELKENLMGMQGILCLLTDTIDKDLIQSSTLKVISNLAVGYNNIDIETARAQNILVGNTPDVLTDATADLTLALMLSAARRLPSARKAIDNNQWKTWEPLGHLGVDLKNKTLGIVGLGRIGRAVAERCHLGFGMKIVYHSPTQKKETENFLKAEKLSLVELLNISDFVSVHCPLNSETKELFDEKAFKMMKPTAIFINTARGEIHNQKALYKALKSDTIFSAGLDVTNPEPIEAKDPLLELDNLVLTPHIGSATIETRDRMAIMAADNLLAGLAGKRLPFSVF